LLYRSCQTFLIVLYLFSLHTELSLDAIGTISIITCKLADFSDGCDPSYHFYDRMCVSESIRFPQTDNFIIDKGMFHMH
jgi:hypothetical protein